MNISLYVRTSPIMLLYRAEDQDNELISSPLIHKEFDNMMQQLNMENAVMLIRALI